MDLRGPAGHHKKTPKKIEKIIFEPQHIQKLSESDQGARKTVQNRQFCQKLTNFSQNLQSFAKSNCRTTLHPTVETTQIVQKLILTPPPTILH